MGEPPRGINVPGRAVWPPGRSHAYRTRRIGIPRRPSHERVEPTERACSYYANSALESALNKTVAPPQTDLIAIDEALAHVESLIILRSLIEAMSSEAALKESS
jgi:hypothetical protein